MASFSENYIFLLVSYRDFLGYLSDDCFTNRNSCCFEWLFPFWKIPPLVVLLLRTTDNFQNGNSRAVIAKFATTEDKSGISDFSMKQLNELVGISDRLLFPNSLDDSCNFCNSHFFSYFHFGKNYLLVHLLLFLQMSAKRTAHQYQNNMLAIYKLTHFILH